MSAPASPSWAPGPGGTGYRRFRYGGADYRASDAERAEVADRLSRHYQDGRLDQAEFNERLDRAMNAKTRADFQGLFADLPDLTDPAAENGQKGQKNPGPPGSAFGSASGSAFGPGGQPGGRPARFGSHHGRPVLSQLIMIAGIVIVAIIVTHALAHAFVPWLLLALLAFVLLRFDRNRRRW
ncbi:MAG TPA: DUF1707 domain-containing protein [Streptosporangiaceae bacterium]|nr:DUF1707 domain-containing protein [Streptosporangiaceae bacterium]